MNVSISRRGLLQVGMPAVAACLLGGTGRLHAAVEAQEEIVPDPEAAPERLSFDLALVERPFRIASRGPKKEAKALAKRMFDLSVEYAAQGVSRSKTPGQVESFLRLFGLEIRYAEEDGGGFVPFCAAGVSFAACKAYCELDPQNTFDPDDPLPTFKLILADINKHYFKPSPAVRYIKADAESAGRKAWVAPGSIKPELGWLVVFSWKRDGKPNHIGIVEKLDGNMLHTVEYNTGDEDRSNGGTVARRKRNVSHVLGYVKTW